MNESTIKFNDLPDNLEMNKEFCRAFDFIENTNQCGFVTGKAGTGKSTLLKYIKANSNKRMALLTPTGIAAINIGGQTIHSFFGFAWNLLEKSDIREKRRLRDLLNSLDTIIIDEVSMVRADLMQAIDYSLRVNMGRDRPFGGLQVILFGDMFQLPPVVKEKELHQYFEPRYGGHYFFNADVFSSSTPEYFELTKIYRQSDKSFIDLLNRVRNKDVTMADLAVLNKRVDAAAIDDLLNPHLILTTTNSQANGINDYRLAFIEHKEFKYEAVIKGMFDRQSYPTECQLRLKKGAQVMLIRNDINRRWVNGSIGTIEELDVDSVKVSIDGYVYNVPLETWEQIEYNYDYRSGKMGKEVVGTFMQYPLKLAWAVTIHKSQGHTFDNVLIDLGGGAFAHGQTYVALSRCTSLNGIVLRNPISMKDIIVDKKIISFTNKYKQKSW